MVNRSFLSRGGATGIGDALPMNIGGRAARALLRSRNLTEYRALVPFPEDVEKVIDKEMVEVGVDGLVLVNYLLAKGLTYPITDILGTTKLETWARGRTGRAQRGMLPHPIARGENKRSDMTPGTIPLYFTWSDFNINIRELSLGRRAGLPVDTTPMNDSFRAVNESIEEDFINGLGFNIEGATAYGLLTHPDINLYQLTGGDAWSAAGHTGDEIVRDILAMKAVLQEMEFNGPNYPLVVDNETSLKFDEDYSTVKGEGTIRDRIKKIAGIDDILVSKRLPADTVVMFQATKDVIRAVDGQRPTSITWDDQPGFWSNYLVMASLIPQIRSNYDGECGIVVGTPSGTL